MRIGSNKGSEVEAYTDFIKEAEGLKSTLRTAWTAEGRQESTAEPVSYTHLDVYKRQAQG